MRKFFAGMAAIAFITGLTSDAQQAAPLVDAAEVGMAQRAAVVGDDAIAIYEVEVNRETGALLSAPVRLQTTLPNSWAPLYSRDGQKIAYLEAGGTGGAQQVVGRSPAVLSIRSLESGDTVSFPLTFSGPVHAYDWSPDGQTFAFRAADQSGGYGLHLIDAATGGMKPLAIGTPEVLRFLQPHWASDSRHLYYGKGVPGINSGHMMERDLETGQERLFFDWADVKTVDGPRRNSTLSPDRRHVAGLGGGGGFSSNTLWVASVEAKSARELALPAGDLSSFRGLPFSWTSDSQALLTKRADGPRLTDPRSLWLVPIDGSSPVKLAINQSIQNLPAAIHPTGRRVAFVSSVSQVRTML